jgi:pimeloyl-ACP methyl ester carboxylesterase
LPLEQKPPVVFVPGGIMPAEISYGPLLSVIGGEIQPIVKNLEIYATETPPANYGLELEVEGIKRVADEENASTFHLVGYSHGGGSSLAFAAKYPVRLRSPALVEPNWMGNKGLSPDLVALYSEYDRIGALPQDQRIAAFGTEFDALRSSTQSTHQEDSART